jgi:predicted flap endonuclease-1-like 5' DNA nuclease
MTKLTDIEGINDVYAACLKTAGVTSVEGLLSQGSTPAGRKSLADASGVSEDKILEWVNHADLYRIKGIGSEYSDLLEEAGVDTVVELAQRNPVNLLEKLTAVNQEKRLVRRLPVLGQVEDWVAQAKALPRVITYN